MDIKESKDRIRILNYFNFGGEYEIVRGEVKELLEYENRCYACQSFDCVAYCENDCGEFCSECGEGSWRDEEAMKECEDHKDTPPIKTYTQEEALRGAEV